MGFCSNEFLLELYYMILCFSCCLVHQNFIGLDVEKNPFVLSVCVTDEDNYGVLQYRTILWKTMV